MFLSKNNFYHYYKIKKTLIKSEKKIYFFSMKGLSFLADMCYYNGEERIRRKELII